MRTGEKRRKENEENKNCERGRYPPTCRPGIKGSGKQHVDWDNIIESSGALLGNFHTHTRDWNMDCGDRRHVTGPKRLVDSNEP